MAKFDTSFSFGANAKAAKPKKSAAPKARKARKAASGKWSGKRGAAFRAALGS